MLIDNINYLRKYNRSIREYLKSHESDLESEPIKVVDAKNGKPTLQIGVNGKKFFIHSKYNPINEAEQLVEKYKDEINNFQHVFFYGIGLGYAVETFAKHFPDLTFTLYEPNPAIFHHYLNNKRIEDLPTRNIKNIQIETSEQAKIIFLNKFASELDENVLLVTLPSYERIFGDKTKLFFKQFKDRVKNKRSNFHVNLAFEKRWTINSMMNFSEVLKTPNILHSIDKSYFKGRPAIIVSAGPSLDEEIENLRYIKENKLAYIFAVGSSNKTLIKNQIYPDAVCTYDPQAHNIRVYEEIIENNIKEIPMIFGSSVGFETIEKYPGLKLHMLTSQDTISNFYLENKGNHLRRVTDAPSIAVITFQLLCHLEANPIIFVGQNLGFKGKYFYSSGINYGMKNELNDEELANALTIKDVDGNLIYTNHSFLSMKTELERYIKQYFGIKVYNTTSGGANIEGAIYKPLKIIIKDKLEHKVVCSDWYFPENNRYDIQFVKEKQLIMDASLDQYNDDIKNWIKIVKNIDQYVKDGQENILEKQFVKYDIAFKNILRNDFFRVFLQPMVRVILEIFERKVQAVRFNKDISNKAREIIKASTIFIYECQKVYLGILPIYEKMNRKINAIEYTEV